MHRTETLRYNWGAKVTTGTPSYLDQGPQGRECEDKTRDRQDYPVKKYQGLQDRKVESSTYYPTPAPTPTQADKDWVFKAWIWPPNDHM